MSDDLAKFTDLAIRIRAHALRIMQLRLAYLTGGEGRFNEDFINCSQI